MDRFDRAEADRYGATLESENREIERAEERYDRESGDRFRRRDFD